MENDTHMEPCVECGTEVECERDSEAICPECGFLVFPCTECEYACNPLMCDWKEGKGCRRFKM